MACRRQCWETLRHTATQLGYMLGSTDAAAAGGGPNGDRTTPMGNGTATCYNTPNLHKLGWIKPASFCDGGQGDNNYNNYGYGEDYGGDYAVSQEAGDDDKPKKPKKPKTNPKAAHKNKHEEDDSDDDDDSNDDSNDDNYDNEDGSECTPLAVGDIQQVELAMTVYGGDIQNPPQPGEVGIRIEPWDGTLWWVV